MDELKYKYQYIAPTALHINEEIGTSQFYTSTAEGFDAQISSLVEVFLVEIYRCKLCQFTSSVKNKISLHVSDMHQHLMPGRLEITNQEDNDSYGIGEEVAQENKENEENLDKLPFLLPMYRLLNTMSPESCDLTLGDHSSNTNVVSTSEVNSLFEEETSQFHLDESVQLDSISSSAAAISPLSQKDKDEADAQCEHLLSLGLCRISNIKTHSLVVETESSKTEARTHSSETSSKDAESGCLTTDTWKKENVFHKQKYICDTCQLDLKTKDTYRTHMQCHNGHDRFKCIYCGCYISKWVSMDKHIQSHRRSRKSYQCLQCRKCFVTQRAWYRHDENCQVFTCTKCSSSFETERIRDLHLSCHHDDVFKCWQCELVDQDWSKLYEHLCIHDITLKPYTCKTCNKKFFREAQLKAHQARHKKHRSCACPLCDQTFKNSYQMSRHQKRFHHKPNISEGKKRKKKKADAHSYVTRVDVYTNSQSVKREFSCDICSRKCSSKLALQRHMGVHAGEKPFQCQQCEYKTRLKASLIQHMRIHTGEKPFKCELCSYASIDSSSLRRHVRSHTNEKPYKCQCCSYSCIQKKSLDLHVRRHHTGEMFHCSVCEYSSPDKQLLQKHVKKYHVTGASELSNVQAKNT
ncbi:zinc finger protein 808 [Bombina bombina]|uniref:zinc finger protein 808 n=1 Tax=Bombina bombina TaxID=8345 RepID=UPI00235A89FA|nr:zinc finger protein 808 [Bombina bombina]XP_053570660.1 zinc finger protein 808 [Bombina bombina]